MSVGATAVEVTLSEAVPNVNASQPSLTNNSNPVNTPPAPGLITVPNTPLGASSTANNFTGGYNYVNTISSTGRYLAASLNILNQGTQP